MAVATYLRIMAVNLRGEMQYRSNFVIMVIVGLVFQGTGFAFIWVVLGRFHALAGWTLGDIAFLYGLRLVSHALCQLVFGRLDLVEIMIRQGDFDRFLVRPLPPLLQVMAAGGWATFIGDLLGGIAIFLAAVRLVGVDWTPLAVLYLLLALIGGALLEAALKLSLVSLSFRLLSSRALIVLVDNLFSSFGNYPLTLYTLPLQMLLTFAVPIAFVAYLPASLLLSRTGQLAIPAVFAYAAPLAGVIWFAAAYFLWTRGIRHYQSTGS